MVIEFRSARTRRAGAIAHSKKTHTYPIHLDGAATRRGPQGEQMIVGFVRLTDLFAIYQGMGERFFSRNIRFGLPSNGSVNKSIRRSISRIVLDEKEDARTFAFNHNGVSLAAEAIVNLEGVQTITEPRLLNGAQTVTTFAEFVKANAGNALLRERQDIVSQISVLCRIVTGATPEFVTVVTINNNRQNPVEAWNLHANDVIQLAIQDKFRDDLHIYYERQQGAFRPLGDEDLKEQGITEHKAIELTKLARTFLASDGNIDKLARFPDVFEDEGIYSTVFNEGRLRADSRKIVLCYKVQFRLRRFADAIVDRGASKYEFVQKSRYLLWALLCQAILNDPKIEQRAGEFGEGLSLEAQFTDWLSGVAARQCRLILSDLVQDEIYSENVAEGNYGFMRANAAFKRSMEIAYRRYGWVVKRLNR